MIELKNVNKIFPEAGNFEILKDISFSAKEGEFVCLLGPSGCGKTILLFLIAGFLEPSGGKILMDGKPVNGIDKTRIMMFQNYVLFPWKTVFSNVLFGLNKIDMDQKEKEELTLHYLNLVGLSQFKNWYIHKLSGGMQQRVALARSLIVNPKLLLMDEPLSALDTQYRRYLRKSLEEIWQKTKKTIILVTHNVGEAVHLADTIYLLTARPAIIKKKYEINLSRPRRSTGEEGMIFSKIVMDIKKDMQEDFEKSMANEDADYEKLNKIFKFNL